ncbi:hypothetical protein AAC387_Pa12g1128 [Persea americana]
MSRVASAPQVGLPADVHKSILFFHLVYSLSHSLHHFLLLQWRPSCINDSEKTNSRHWFVIWTNYWSSEGKLYLRSECFLDMKREESDLTDCNFKDEFFYGTRKEGCLENDPRAGHFSGGPLYG